MNWKMEAIEHLNRYEAMVRAVENIPSEINRLEQVAMGLRGVKLEQVRCMTPQRGDDTMISNFVKRQELENAYRNARLWVDTTDNALSALDPEEKRVLLDMYIRPSRGAVSVLCEALGVEQSTVYRKRDSALYRFTMALYGVQ